MRTVFVMVVAAACVFAITGVTRAQKTVLPGHPSTPPPKQALPGNPTTPPPMHSPGTDGSFSRGESYRGQQGPTVGSGMPQGMSREDARRRFEQCINQNTRNNTLSGQGMATCVAGWMPPAELARFNNCWNDPKTSAWECFGRAYN